MDLLEKLLLSKARAGIFKTLFMDDREYYLRELERKTGVGFRALHIDLHRMSELDIISMRRDGNRTYFRANTAHPLYEDFHSIAHKVHGPVPILKELFSGQKKVGIVFLFGSYAKGETHAGSDLDLFIIGDISARKLSEILWQTQKDISYEINDHIFSKKEFLERIREGDHFINSLKKTKKKFVKGTQDEFERLFE